MEENKNEEKVEKIETKTEETPTSNTENVETDNSTKSEEKVVDNSNETKKEESKTEETKKKKGSSKLAIIIIIVAIIIGAIAALVYFFAFAPKNIDLSKYINVEYDGFDGYATAEVEIDEKELKEYLNDSKLAKKFASKAELEIKDNEKLSNGNELEIKVSISSNWLKENRLKIKDKTVKIKIENLEEANVVDLFKDIDVELEGVSPDLSISVNNNNSDQFIRKVTYSVNKSYGLANDDKVTITAHYNSNEAKDAGIVVAEDTMEYTIKDQPYYASSKDDLKEDALNSIKADLLEEVKDQIKSDGKYVITYNYNTSYSETYTNTEPELVNMYILTPKQTNSYYTYSYNTVYGIYKVVFTSSTGTNYEWYYVASISNVALNNDGSFTDKDYSTYCSDRWDDGKTKQEAYDEQIDSKKSDNIIETIL